MLWFSDLSLLIIARGKTLFRSSFEYHWENFHYLSNDSIMKSSAERLHLSIYLFSLFLLFTYTEFTVFENHSKCRILHFWHLPTIFDLLKVTCLVTLFDRKLQLSKNSPKLTTFVIFNELLSTQNVNVARSAQNVE